jgi:hypothetical protein
MIKVTNLVAAMAKFVGKEVQLTVPPLAGSELARNMKQALSQDIVAIGHLENKPYPRYS